MIARITRDFHAGKTIIEGQFIASGQNYKCIIHSTGTGNNSEGGFTLDINKGGQIDEGCSLKMYGPIERSDLIELLKSIIEEAELVK